MENTNMKTYRSCFSRIIVLLMLATALRVTQAVVHLHLESKQLCNQCAKCETRSCPASEAYPHMTAFDDSLIAGSLQSDFVGAGDRGVHSVPPGNTTEKTNIYYGWESTSGSASGYHRFRNYMDKCSGGQSYLTVDKHDKVTTRSLSSLKSLAEADWKSINPPKKLNHRSVRFWLSGSTGKCLTVFSEKKGGKQRVGVAECRFDGSNPFQLFAFRYHYHNAFCCCGVHNS